MHDDLSFWITPSCGADRKNCHFFAQKNFSINRIPQSLKLKIACESYYVLTLNDVLIGRGPARGSSRIYFYDVYELAAFLREGSNTLKAEVLCMNVPPGRNVPLQPALRVECGEARRSAVLQYAAGVLRMAGSAQGKGFPGSVLCRDPGRLADLSTETSSKWDSPAGGT